MESLERVGVLAKQVLSQLSYTPIVSYSNHFPLLTLPPQPIVLRESCSTLDQVLQTSTDSFGLFKPQRQILLERLGIFRRNVVPKKMSCRYFGQMPVRSHRFQVSDTKSAKAVKPVVIEPLV